MQIRRYGFVAVAVCLSVGGAFACSPKAPVAGSGDAAFTKLAGEVLEDNFKRHPTQATDLGIHSYDDQLEDASSAAVAAEVAALRGFQAKLAAIDPATLTL